MLTPTLLDLFCGAGGAAMGYHRAGFRVIGVDNRPQPRYPFQFIQADALKYLAECGHCFDAIHTSPPCQADSIMRRGRWQDREHPQLIPQTRELLLATGKPYVIENVVGAALIDPILLCGTMFGLRTRYGSQLRRHRLFEVPGLFLLTPPCQHNDGSPIGVYGGGQHPDRKRPATVGVWGNAGSASIRDGVIQFSAAERREAMGIDWMTMAELSQAIPPAYTEFIGRHLMEAIQQEQTT